MEKFSQRIRYLRKEVARETLRVFADRVGTSPGYLHELESGRKEHPSDEFLRRVCEKTGAARLWLENGKGPILANAPANATHADALRMETDQILKWFVEPLSPAEIIRRMSAILADTTTSDEAKTEMLREILPALERKSADLERVVAEYRAGEGPL